MASLIVEPVQKSMEHQVMAVMTMGFSADPTARWIWPDPHQYVAHFPAFTKAYAGAAFEYDAVHGVAGAQGFAMWLPPGIHSDDESVEASIRASVSPARHAEVFALFEEMGSYHPAEPHWFLPLIAVDPWSRVSGVALSCWPICSLAATVISRLPISIALTRRMCLFTSAMALSC
jgi:hypothetical protein